MKIILNKQQEEGAVKLHKILASCKIVNTQEFKRMELNKEYKGNKEDAPYITYFIEGLSKSNYFIQTKTKSSKGNKVITFKKRDTNPLLIDAVREAIYYGCEFHTKGKGTGRKKNTSGDGDQQIATNCTEIKETKKISPDFTSLSFELKMEMMHNISSSGEWKDEFINLLFTR